MHRLLRARRAGVPASSGSSRYLHVSATLSIPRVFAFGRASEGQTGVSAQGKGSNGHHGPRDPFEGTSITSPPSCVAASPSASAIATKDGKIFATGRGPSGNLGLGDALLQTSSFCAVDLPEGDRFVHVVMGPHASHTAFISANGRKVMMAGTGSEGQLGLGGLLGVQGSYHGGSQPSRVCTPAPVAIFGGDNNNDDATNGPAVSQIALARTRSVLLTSDGKVLAAGSGYHGELGIGTNAIATAPIGWGELDEEQDEANHGFPADAAGKTKDNNLEASSRKGTKNDDDDDFVDAAEFANSSHTEGRATMKGTDSSHPAIADAKELRRRQQQRGDRVDGGALPKFVSIGAGLHFTLAASEDGRLFFCGRVGHPGKRSFVVEKGGATPPTLDGEAEVNPAHLASRVPIPLSLPGLANSAGVKLQVSCGSHHAAITDGSSRLWLFGTGFVSDNGTSSGKEAGVGPHLLHLERYIGFSPKTLSVSCGPYSTAIVADGKLYLMGRMESPYLFLSDADVKKAEKAGAADGDSIVGGTAKIGEGLGLFEDLIRNNSINAASIDFVATLSSPTLVRHKEINGKGRRVLDVALGTAHALVLVEDED